MVCFLTVGILSNFAAAQTGAQNPTSDTSNRRVTLLDNRLPVIGHLVGVVLYIIKWLLGKLVYLIGMMLDAVLNITTFTNIPVVRHGWTLVRDLANMFFALILLIIAFATILHIESYGMKQLLWKLVVSAILINFSFTLAGLIIDFSQVLTVFFIEKSRGPGGQISAKVILDGLQIDKLYVTDTNNSWVRSLWNIFAGALGGPTVGTILDMILIIVILAVTAFSIGGLAVLFLVRIVALWILLILSPLAWFCMVLPATQSIWHKWWGEFLKWSFFAPAATFFLYLSIYLIDNKTLFTEMLTPAYTASGDKTQYISSFLSDPRFLLQYICILIFLLGGVLVARQMGIMGANAVITLGKSAKSLALGTVAGAGAAGGIWAGRRALVGTGSTIDRAGANLAAKATQWKTQGGFLTRQFGRALGQASRPLTRYAERGRQEIVRQEKAYAAMSGEHQRRELPFASPAGQAAIMKNLAEKSPQMLGEAEKKYLAIAKRIGGDTGAILTAKPDWAKEIGEDTKHWTAESLRKGMVSKWDAETAANPEVQDALRELMPSTQAYANIINSWAGDVRDRVLGGLKDQFQDTDFTNPEMMKRRKAYAAATGSIHKAFADKEDNVVSDNTAQQDEIKKHIESLKAEALGEIHEERDLKLLGEHITTAQIANDRGQISAAKKKIIVQAMPAGSEAAKMAGRLDSWNVEVRVTPSASAPTPGAHLAEYAKQAKF
ncbi:MAG: hypothetical protein HY813_00495 [Candidatus Portnoybacteria bacterium]|nr:hypothetical protein [Candidatus Portnoybacteria bacterium]